MKRKDLIKKLEAVKCRSAWTRGVKAYALEMVEELEQEEMPDTFLRVEWLLLNGAEDWKNYSWGGCSLIYNEDIALRLCTPSEYRKTRGGQLRPNKQEQWLDTQARACYQASRLIIKTMGL